MKVSPFAAAALGFYLLSATAGFVQLLWNLGDEPAVVHAVITLVSCSGCLVLAVLLEVAQWVPELESLLSTPPNVKPAILTVPHEHDESGIRSFLWATERLAAGMAGVSSMILYARCGALLGDIGFYAALVVQMFVVLPRAFLALRPRLCDWFKSNIQNAS